MGCISTWNCGMYMNVMCFNFTFVIVTRRNSAFGIPCGQQVVLHAKKQLMPITATRTFEC